jgi:hypothetical protein
MEWVIHFYTQDARDRAQHAMRASWDVNPEAFAALLNVYLAITVVLPPFADPPPAHLTSSQPDLVRY